ncbi:2-dehydro-3-deoxygalactonokinase [Ancylobacter terrae]|uniref:2-dehydro-3-deoxygalactonokinase n=1 Tax=Ancylobacter sp. sgz301288 TaxID=3342077 RepID=UPI00385AB5E6
MDRDTVSHIAVDWGTSSFRLWALDAAGRVRGERRSAEGLAHSSTAGFEAVLESHIAALGLGSHVPVIACGMVGSRHGWQEAAYLDVPVPLDRLIAGAIPVRDARRPVRILPGIARRERGEPDVMRGEETQLLGLAANLDRSQDILACLPGTHSKWVRIRAGAVNGFATFMTGELFQLLRTGSVIAPAVEAAPPVDPDEPAFAAGVADALAAPASMTNRLFGLRAGWLVEGTPPGATLARLSGLLIGTELAGARQRFGSLDGTALVVSGPAAALYTRALAIAGSIGIAVFDAETCVREGLHAAALTLFPQLDGATP